MDIYPPEIVNAIQNNGEVIYRCMTNKAEYLGLVCIMANQES